VGQTARERLEALQKDINSEYGFFGLLALHKSVQQALDEPAPRGSSNEIGHYALTVGAAGQSIDWQRTWVQAYAKDPLPDVWTGMAASTASATLSALDNQLRRVTESLDQASKTLGHLSSAVDEANGLDPRGLHQLEHARLILQDIGRGLDSYDSGQMKEAHHAAMDGIATRVKAARLIEEASKEASRALSALSSKVRASRFTDPKFSALDRILLADTATASTGPHDANLILTADAATRAEQKIDHLGADDRDRFFTLLHGARSPQERAYLLQALAAGYGVKEVQAFDAKIHEHGADPLWLQRHLTPISETAGPDQFHDQRPVEFGSRAWTQGSDPTCVAMSTVMARAEVDPLYALQLTTGGHPGDPAYDNGDAFAQRLHDEQHRVYDDGRNWLQDLFDTDGMTDGQARDVANEEVAPRTGASYHEVTMHSDGDRRGVLPDVEKAVDQGLPVTFSVRDDHGGHEMAIVGHQGGMLEVYNPWGYTVWVGEDDFVNNRMNVVGDGVPATVHTVNVPRR
jgi:uncharacterized protein YukE